MPEIMGKVELKKQHKQDALFDTAFELFTSKGLNNTSISDIVQRAGIAKGTFYLYFKDKYDLQNKLIASKANQIFMKAYHAMEKENVTEFEDQLIFLADYILEHLRTNKPLLTFISKNISWGILGAMEKTAEKTDSEFLAVYHHIVDLSVRKFRNPDVMLFMIIELINSTCYSAILFEEPVPLDELKPMLYQAIRDILKSQEIA